MTAKEFILSIPERVNPTALAGVDTCFHFKIGGSGDYTIVAKDGTITTEEGLVGEAKCVVSCEEQLLADIAAGKANPQMAVFSGKLKISNLGEMLKYAKMFGMM